MRYEKRPYQARQLLKSIRYWQSVVNGELPAKRRFAYYVNKLAWYTEADIAYLEEQAKIWHQLPNTKAKMSASSRADIQIKHKIK